MAAGGCPARSRGLGSRCITAAFFFSAVAEAVLFYEVRSESFEENATNATNSTVNASEVAAEMTAEEIEAKLAAAEAKQAKWKQDTAALEAALTVRNGLDAEAKRMADALRANGQDLGTITLRFSLIDAKIESLKTEFTTLNDVVLQVRSEANATGVSLAQSESTLGEAMALAQTNKAKAAAIAATFVNTSAQIEAARNEMARLKAVIAEVEQTSLTLGDAAANVGGKVGGLELAVNELLPGKEFLPSRIARAQQHLTTYQSTIDSGSLDAVVASTIRANFARATKSTERFTDQTLQNQLVEEVD